MKKFFFDNLFAFNVLAGVLLISLIFFSSCGPSKEEMDSYRKYPQTYIDSMWEQNGWDKFYKPTSALSDTIVNSEVKDKPSKVRTYYASEFGIVATGTVVGFTLNNDAIESMFAMNKPTPFYMKVTQSDGTTTVVEGTHKLYYTLNEGDILK